MGAVTVGYVAAQGLLLSSPMLADTAADTVDACAMQFLLQAALLQKKKKEVKERRREWEEEAREWEFREINHRVMRGEPLTEDEDATWRQSHGLPPLPRRKRKKRRKKLPRSGTRRLQRQWYCSAGFAGCDSPRAVFPLVDDWHQKDSSAVVVLAVAYAWLVLLVLLLVLCFLLLTSGPDALHHGWYGPEGHVRSWLVSLSGPLYLAVTCLTLGLPEEYNTWIVLGDDFRKCRIQLFTWFDSGYIFMSVYRGLVGFHALREGGPRILIVRSIPSCPRLSDEFHTSL